MELVKQSLTPAWKLDQLMTDACDTKISKKFSTPPIILEPGIHQVFNSTILEAGFYIQLQEHRDPETNQNTRMRYEDIDALCCYMHNRTIDELVRACVLDRYLRLRVEPDAVCEMIQDHYQIEHDGNQQISDVLYNALIVKESVIFSDWTKIYPASIKGLPFQDIERVIRSDVPWFSYRRQCNKSSRITMRMDWLQRDAIDTSISYQTSTGYYLYETNFMNQFGNLVTLVISSNSDRMNAIMENLDQAIDTAADLRIVIGRTKRLVEEHKLLCSFIIDPKSKRKGE